MNLPTREQPPWPAASSRARGNPRMPLGLRSLPLRLGALLVLVASGLAAAGLSTAQATPVPATASAAPSSRPCDTFAANGNACVAAYSTVRSLFAGYTGALYRVSRASDGAATNVGLLSSGYADAGAQDAFCQRTVCTVIEIFDQSARGNHLSIAPVGEAGSSAVGARADALPVTVGGHRAYGLQVTPRVAYRRAVGDGMATGGQPESMYWVASGTMATNACCFDFGNVERTSTNTGAGHMSTLIMSTFCGAPPCTGKGPWIQADLENGVFMGDGTSNPANVSQTSPFVTGVLRNDGQTSFALDGGNATAASLTALFKGSLPEGYKPMQLEGGIGLGAGGDNSNAAPGAFFEGAITSGFAPDASVSALQSEIASIAYAGTSGGGPGVGITGPGGKCVDVNGDDNGVGGAAIQLWDCLHDAVDQHWMHIRTIPTVHLTSGVNEYPNTLKTMGRCLEIEGNRTAAGTPIQLWDCNGLGGQEWVIGPNGSLRNPQSGLCLTSRGGATANGTRLEIQSCSGAASQRFIVTPGLLIQSTPIDAPGGKCVDVAGSNNGGNGASVVTSDCQREANDQSWWHKADGSLTTLGRCLDIVNNSTSAGAKLQLWDCNGVGGQKWVQQSDGALVNPPSGLCLTDSSNGATNGTVLTAEQCNGSSAQRFKVSSGLMVNAPGNGKCADTAGNDTYGNWYGPAVQIWTCIEHAADQHWVHTSTNTLETMTRCLDVAGNSTASGSKVILFNCNGLGAQQWVQLPDGTFLNPPSGLCLTAPDTVDGSQFQITQCLGSPNQKFVHQGTTSLRPGVRVSLRATTPCCTGGFVRHSFGRAVLSTIHGSSADGDKQDATWIVRAGLANNSCISLESANYPGGFLRRMGDEVYQHQNDGSAQFASDATFCTAPGPNGKGLALRAHGNTTEYLRHYEGKLYMAVNGGPDAWDTGVFWGDDVTWLSTTPWKP